MLAIEEEPATSAGGSSTTPVRNSTVGSISLLQATPKASKQNVKESPNAPKSKNSRSQWKPLVVKEGGTYDIMMKIKHANGDTGLFCNTGPNAKVRDIWEAAVEFEVTKVGKKGLCECQKHCRVETYVPSRFDEHVHRFYRSV